MVGIAIGRVRMASTGWPGGPGLNTFYFTGQSAGTPSDFQVNDAQLAVDRVHDAITAGIDLYPTIWTGVVSPNVDVLDSANGELMDSFSVATPPSALGGNGPAGFGPAAIMLLLQLRTSTFDDGSRLAGRAFLGPIGQAADADGSPTAGVIATAAAVGTALLDEGVGDENPALVVWRRPRLAAAGPPVVTARDGSTAKVTSTGVPDRYSILRSRRD